MKGESSLGHISSNKKVVKILPLALCEYSLLRGLLFSVALFEQGSDSTTAPALISSLYLSTIKYHWNIRMKAVA